MRTPSFERESPEREAHLISLAETVRRYMRALGAKEQIGAGIGISDDPRARLGGFGEFNPSNKTGRRLLPYPSGIEVATTHCEGGLPWKVRQSFSVTRFIQF